MDLRKILKYCPEGWKFYSTIFGDETCVLSIDQYEGNPCPITIYHSKLGKSTPHKIARNGHPFAERCGECCLFPSREMRDWFKFSAYWYKKERFDPKTLKPFDKVLISINGEWQCDFFSYMLSGDIFNKRCIGVGDINIVIPYNDDTKHLVGTNKAAPEFYRYWEN